MLMHYLLTRRGVQRNAHAAAKVGVAGKSNKSESASSKDDVKPQRCSQDGRSRQVQQPTGGVCTKQGTIVKRQRCSHADCSQGGCGRQVQQGRVCFNQGQCETPTLQPRQAWQASLTMWSMHQARDDSETPMLQPSRCAVHKTDATADAAESEKFIECFWTRVESNTKTQI